MDSDSSESGSEQPRAKKAKSHDDNVSSQDPEHPSQWSQDVIIEAGPNEEQLNIRHTITVIVNTRKRKRQHREQNTEDLNQYEAEKNQRPRCLQSIARPSTSSSIDLIDDNYDEILEFNDDKKIKLNNDDIKKIKNDEIIELKPEDIIDANSQSTFGLGGTQKSPIPRNEKNNEKEYLQKKEDVNNGTGSKTEKKEIITESSSNKELQKK